MTTKQAPARRTGRPPKSPEEVLSAPMQVRLTVGERQALRQLAEREGCSVTDLIRSAVREVIDTAPSH